MGNSGIDPKWANIIKRLPASKRRWRQTHESNNRAELEYFAVHGKSDHSGIELPPLDQPNLPWETFLGMDLGTYAHFRLADLEDSIEGGKSWDIDAAYSAFFAASLSIRINLFIHARFPTKFPGRSLAMMGMDQVAFLALGLVIGDTVQFNSLASLLIEASRRSYFYDKGLHPIYAFMLRLCAASTQAKDISPEGEEAEPVLLSLFDRWRSPDPNNIAELCLAACDFHTRRCSVSRKHFHEFESGFWASLPIELLLLFKLRELSGLANPTPVHPLTSGLRGALPKLTPMSLDPLLVAVADRMRETGYADEVVHRAMWPTWLH